MAEDIVGGLFGVSPDEMRAQRRAAAEKRAYEIAQLDPVQRASYLTSAGGAGLMGGLMEATGAYDKEKQDYARRQQLLSQIDMQTPEGILKAAEIARSQGDYQTQIRLQQLANQREKELAEIKPKSAEQPTSVQEYGYAVSQGYKGTFQDWLKEKAAANRTNVSVNLPAQEKGFETELGKKQAQSLIESRASAEDAAQIINTVNEGRSILDKGIVSGFGANAIVGFGMALKQAGIDYGGDELANTQAYTANMAQNVGKIIKQFGAGTGLSDADRQYAQKMAGGEITIDEKAIRKILDINERAAKNVINMHNRKAKGVKTNIPLEVEMPSTTLGKGGIPQGIDPNVWAVMTPEEKALWTK